MRKLLRGFSRSRVGDRGWRAASDTPTDLAPCLIRSRRSSISVLANSGSSECSSSTIFPARCGKTRSGALENRAAIARPTAVERQKLRRRDLLQREVARRRCRTPEAAQTMAVQKGVWNGSTKLMRRLALLFATGDSFERIFERANSHALRRRRDDPPACGLAVPPVTRPDADRRSGPNRADDCRIHAEIRTLAGPQPGPRGRGRPGSARCRRLAANADSSPTSPLHLQLKDLTVKEECPAGLLKPWGRASSDCRRVARCN